MPSKQELQLAFALCKGIGPLTGRRIIRKVGSIEKVFALTKKELMEQAEIGANLATAIVGFDNWKLVEKEMQKVLEHDWQFHFCTDSNFPDRLSFCSDAPLLLFSKGNLDFFKKRMVAVVGTRHPSAYGVQQTKKLMEGLSEVDVGLVSGLANGIDTVAHTEALKLGMQNIAVLGHGLDRVYPSANKGLATSMQGCGGLVTEFLTGTEPERENFPKRNRIVAAMCDALIVVESGIGGGALLTATLANSYQRQVFVFPGRVDSKTSEGCNKFIAQGQAILFHEFQQLLTAMGWGEKKGVVQNQLPLLSEMGPEEEEVFQLLKGQDGRMHIDEICWQINFEKGKLPMILLGMECKSWISCLPGKIYSI